MSSAFDVKIRFMEDTIPSGRYCKTARGRMGKCRELTEFRRTALQLCRHADTDTHRQRADDLVAEIDRRRAELAQGGNFARQIADNVDGTVAAHMTTLMSVPITTTELVGNRAWRSAEEGERQWMCAISIRS